MDYSKINTEELTRLMKQYEQDRKDLNQKIMDLQQQASKTNLILEKIYKEIRKRQNGCSC